jgi:HK97 gp10 family phage protein
VSDVVIRVQGLDELKQRLESLNDGRAARAMMRTGSRKAAQVLLATQQETVPFETGRLEGALGIQVKTADADKLQVLIGPDQKLNYIGRFHEFGTKFMAGVHWMQKAFDASSNDALAAYITEVKRLLDKQTYADLMAAIQSGLSSGAE